MRPLLSLHLVIEEALSFGAATSLCFLHNREPACDALGNCQE